MSADYTVQEKSTLNESPILIALGCTAGVGKDTFVQLLKEEYGDEYHFVEVRLAAPIYSIMYFIQNEIDYMQHKDRRILIAVGEICRKIYGADVWVNIALKKIKIAMEEPSRFGARTVIYVPDMRRKNEMDALVGAKFKTILIKRKEATVDEVARRDKNEGEIANEKFDHIVNNDGSIDELRATAKKIFEELSKSERS